MLVVLIQSVNFLLGFATYSWPSSLPSTVNALMWLKVYGKLLLLACRGMLTATAIVLVEELLFRSWLPEEIGADLCYHRGIIISGLAFALFQGYASHLLSIKLVRILVNALTFFY